VFHGKLEDEIGKKLILEHGNPFHGNLFSLHENVKKAREVLAYVPEEVFVDALVPGAGQVSRILGPSQVFGPGRKNRGLRLPTLNDIDFV
jgi:hypothetical protein